MEKSFLEFLFAGPLFSIFKGLNTIQRKLGDMATQAEVDALGVKIDEIKSSVSSDIDGLVSEFAALKEQLANIQPPLDLSGVESKLDSLKETVGGLDTVVADNVVVSPEPEPTPEPEPVEEIPVEGSPGEPTV